VDLILTPSLFRSRAYFSNQLQYVELKPQVLNFEITLIASSAVHNYKLSFGAMKTSKWQKTKKGTSSGSKTISPPNLTFSFHLYIRNTDQMENSGKPFLVEVKDLTHAIAEKKEKIVLIDTRSPDAFAKEHIPNAVNIHECFTFLATSDEQGMKALEHKFVDLFGKVRKSYIISFK
jgi:hypothetical protein